MLEEGSSKCKGLGVERRPVRGRKKRKGNMTVSSPSARGRMA